MVKTIIGKVVGEDGKSLEFAWNGEGNRLGVRVEGDDIYTYSSDLTGERGPQGDGAHIIRFEQVTDNETGEEKVQVQYYDPDNLSEPIQTEDFVIVGQQGDTGMYYYPNVDSAGNLTWTMYPPSISQSLPTAVNIKGPKGDTGDPATGVALENFLWFEVDTDETSNTYGDLYVMGYDGVEADFEYDDDPTSDTYGGLFRVYDDDNKVFLGNVKGPVGSVSDDVSNRVTALESTVSTLQSTVSSLQSTDTSLQSQITNLLNTYNAKVAELEGRISSLQSQLDLIEEEESKQNALLGND